MRFGWCLAYWVFNAAFTAAVIGGMAAMAEEIPLINKKDTGYRGLWYYNGKIDTEYVYKYSGGLGTYCAKHIPHAIYAPEADKTFFVYGGTYPKEDRLLEMVSYYDHKTGMVPRPTIVMDKETPDAHDNPVLSIDADGYLYVFASAHGTGRPAYIYKSSKPYSIDHFEGIWQGNYSYPQPWYMENGEFLFLHTRYDEGRRFLFTYTSKDGAQWTEPKPVSRIESGHYQVSRPRDGASVGTAFNYHPDAFNGDKTKAGLNWRTNLYYVYTDDMGATWRNAEGDVLDTPLTEPQNAALAVEYESQGLLAYLKDVNYDKSGNPVILHVVATTWEPGNYDGVPEMRVAHWTGQEWEVHAVIGVNNNYDTGSIYIEKDGTWRIIAPTEDGPQLNNPGGEVAVWVSKDQGRTWQKKRQATRGSVFNHTYCRRPVNAHSEFYAFWADGHGRRPSESRLYFCDKTGRRVFRLPYVMDEPFEKPERVRTAPGKKHEEGLW